KLGGSQGGGGETAEHRDSAKPGGGHSVHVPGSRAGHRPPSESAHSRDAGQQEAAYRGEAADERVFQTGMHLLPILVLVLLWVRMRRRSADRAAPRYRVQLGYGPDRANGRPTEAPAQPQATTVEATD